MLSETLLKQLQTELSELSDKFSAVHNLQIKVTVPKNPTTYATLQVKVAEKDLKGIVLNEQAIDLKLYGYNNLLGKSFSSAGVLYRITGFDKRRRKTPVVCQRASDGKECRFTVQHVQTLLAKSPSMPLLDSVGLV